MNTLILEAMGFRFDVEGSKNELITAQKNLAQQSKTFKLECVIDDEMTMCNEGTMFATPNRFRYIGDITWYNPTEEEYTTLKSKAIEMGMEIFGDVDFYKQ